MAQVAIQLPTDINIKIRKVAILHLHGELDIPVKANQMVKKPLQLLWSMWSDDKSVILIIEPAWWFVGCLC